MSLSSNLDLRPCPKCGVAILTSADKCQFCGVEVAPIAAAQSAAQTKRPTLRRSQPQAWQEVANTIIGILWILSGLYSLIGGALFILFGIGTIVIGIGIVRQEWYALAIGKAISFFTVAYAIYLLIAIPAFAQAGRPMPILYPLSLIAVAVLQGYIFWCVSD